MTKRILLCGILLSSHFIFATDFVFNQDSLFVKKSADFVQKVSTELFEKTGVNFYVYMANQANGSDYLAFKSQLLSKFLSPYVAIVLIKDIKKIDIIASNEDLLDVNKVYWDYMVPLLPSKDSELTSQVLSAVVFNGYVESVDLIADKFKTNIEQNLPKDEKGAKTIMRMILYVMLFSMIGLFAWVYFVKKKGES